MAKFKKFIQNDNNLAIAYYIYSSHFQNKASVDQQRKEAERYAESKGFRIIKEYVDSASGKPMQVIANELNEQGVTTALGRKFTVNGLRIVLYNKAYTGVYQHSGITIPDGMPVIISEELFEEVQKRFVLNKRKGSQRANGMDENNVPRYWLTRKLFCGECGTSLQGVSGTSKTGRGIITIVVLLKENINVVKNLLEKVL